MLGLMVWLALIAVDDLPPEGCKVEVSGIPISVMRHHRLAIDTEDERPLASRMQLALHGRSAHLRVLGPRYGGERQIEAGECREGAVVALEAVPLPARITIPCAPEGLTVACEGPCPAAMGDRVFLLEDLPPIPMTSFSEEVELLMRAPGYRRQTQRVQLHPGPNRVLMEMERLPGGG